jgi:S-adenosylmethionine synthetase
MGRTPVIVTKRFKADGGSTIENTVELFTWEKLDYVDKLKEVFAL